MNRYEELEKAIKDAQAEAKRLKAKWDDIEQKLVEYAQKRIEKLEREEARKAWEPKGGGQVLVLHANGSVTDPIWTGSVWQKEVFAQGRIAPDTEAGRTWLEAIGAWEKALHESYDERAKGEGGVWWYWNLECAASTGFPSDLRFGVVCRRSPAEAEQDGERWGKRLAQGRGF